MSLEPQNPRLLRQSRRVRPCTLECLMPSCLTGAWLHNTLDAFNLPLQTSCCYLWITASWHNFAFLPLPYVSSPLPSLLITKVTPSWFLSIRLREENTLPIKWDPLSSGAGSLSWAVPLFHPAVFHFANSENVFTWAKPFLSFNLSNTATCSDKDPIP